MLFGNTLHGKLDPLKASERNPCNQLVYVVYQVVNKAVYTHYYVHAV